MKHWILTAFAVGTAVCAVAAHPHHSISAVYDGTRPMSLEGIVVQFRFVNPHPSIVLDVKEADGTTQRWTLEMDNRWELAEVGFGNETLKPGDLIVVTGSLARTQPHSLYVRRLLHPADGFKYEHSAN
jgi:Family of unknown function (DUF6152)